MNGKAKCHISIIKEYLALKRNELPIYALIWMNLKNMLKNNKITESRDRTLYYDCHYIIARPLFIHVENYVFL